MAKATITKIIPGQVQKTYQEVFTFVTVGTRWLKDNNSESKLRYAVKKIMKLLEKTITEYQEKVEDVNIEHCSVDEAGVILTDAKGGFQYTKENLRKRNVELRGLLEKTTPVLPFFAPYGEELSEKEIEAFVGFAIEPVAPQAQE